MLTIVGVLAALPAHAQTGPPSRVDPAYLAYLDALDLMEREGYAPPPSEPQPQLWPGMVGFVDTVSGLDGRISVVGGYPDLQETWFLRQVPAPDHAFQLVHEGAASIPEQLEELGSWNPDWQVDPCFVMGAHYHGEPNLEYTLALVYDEGIDRTDFVLVQYDDQLQHDVVVGRMLREHHHVQGAEERFVDHWAFTVDYAPPSDVGQEVRVLPTTGVYGDTASWFADVMGSTLQWQAFAQIQYKTLVGLECVGALK